MLKKASLFVAAAVPISTSRTVSLSFCNPHFSGCSAIPRTDETRVKEEESCASIAHKLTSWSEERDGVRWGRGRKRRRRRKITDQPKREMLRRGAVRKSCAHVTV